MFILTIRFVSRCFEKPSLFLNARITPRRKLSFAPILYFARSHNLLAPTVTSSNEPLTNSHRSNIFRPLPHRKDKRPSDESILSVVAVPMGKAFNLERFISAFSSSIATPYLAPPFVKFFQRVTLPDEIRDSLLYSTNENDIVLRRLFFAFQDGTLVLWNMKDEERHSLIRFVSAIGALESPLDPAICKQETDSLPFSYTSGHTRVHNNRIFLSLPRTFAGSSDESSAQPSAAPASTMPHKYGEQTSASSSSAADQTQTRTAEASASPETTSESSPAAERASPVGAAATHLQSEELAGSSREHTAAAPVVSAVNSGLASDLNLEQFALSNALALSVKLGVYESQLSGLAEFVEKQIEILKTSKGKRATTNTLNQKLGELYIMRHQMQWLAYEPDVYWERERLNFLDERLRMLLSIRHRKKLIDEHSVICCEQLDALLDRLMEEKHTRLEWYIIILIAIEGIIAFVAVLK